MTVTIKSRPYQYSHTVGALGLTGRGFSNPMDAAISKKTNRVYVVNRSNPFQAPQGGVRVGVVTLEEEYIGQFGGFGTDDGEFTWPTSIAIDSQDYVYVTDEHRHDVQVFDGDGNFVRKWGSLGADAGEFNRPSGVAVDSHDHVYIVDHLNNRIQKFTRTARCSAAGVRLVVAPASSTCPGVSASTATIKSSWPIGGMTGFRSSPPMASTLARLAPPVPATAS